MCGKHLGTKTNGDCGNVRIILLVLVVFCLGVLVSAFWFASKGSHEAGSGPGAPVRLSTATKTVLGRLTSPVELRFYSLLDTNTLPDSVPAFASRVDRLLEAYQQEAKGHVQVIRRGSGDPDSEAAAASTDGIKPFNIERGAACFLGIAVVKGDKRETLPRLSAEWEQALEFDLTRAIERILEGSARPVAIAPPQTDPVVREEVKRALPDLDNLSLEEGQKLLREAALKEFTQAAKEMQAQVKEAQERLSVVLKSGSKDEQQAAIKHLRKVQVQQQDRLDQIAARSQEQVDALKELKNAAP